MSERVRGFVRRLEPWQAIAAALLLLAVVLIVVAVGVIGVWLSVRSIGQELDRQPPVVEARAPQTLQSPPPRLLPEALVALSPEQRPEILNLSVMDIIGYLQYGPGGNAFVCNGPISGQQDTVLWNCRSAPEGGPPVYEVRVRGDGPLSIFSVEATVSDASQEQAADFLGYVGSLAFEESEPVNVQAWVEKNVPTGGQMVASGAELALYGTTEVRTLIVAGVPREASGGVTVEIPGQAPLTTIPEGTDIEDSD